MQSGLCRDPSRRSFRAWRVQGPGPVQINVPSMPDGVRPRCRAAELGRGHVEHAPEDACHVALVRETAMGRDDLQWRVGADQQLLGALDPSSQHIGVWRTLEICLKLPDECKHAELRQSGQFCQRNVLPDVFVHVLGGNSLRRGTCRTCPPGSALLPRASVAAWVSSVLPTCSLSSHGERPPAGPRRRHAA